MYIRRTKTKTAEHGDDSYTYRIVESVREGTHVKQHTLLNLGKDFAIEPAHWPLLTARIDQLLQGSAPHQAELFHLADEVGQLLEAAAERYSDLIIAKLAQPMAVATAEQDYQRVNINHIEAHQARSIGAETLAWHAVIQLQLEQKLTALGFNKIDAAAALGSIIARMISPGSELHTHAWLQSCTGLDGTKIKANASKHKALSHGHIEKLEAQLREEVQALLAKAAETDQQEANDGHDLPAEIARREHRLQALADAKTKIAKRAAQRDQHAQQEYADKVARREAQRAAGQKPRGKEPKAPETGPKAKDQINLTDEESRIMPSHEGFVQAYNGQAAVDVDSMLIVAATLTQHTNDKQQVEPMLDELAKLPPALGKPGTLLADNGYFSQGNVKTCAARSITPLIALGRDAHHLPLEQRLAADAPEPDSDDPVVKMAHALKTKQGRAQYGKRKCTVEPVFGIIKQIMGFRQFSLRGLQATSGEWKLVAMAYNLKRMQVLAAG